MNKLFIISMIAGLILLSGGSLGGLVKLADDIAESTNGVTTPPQPVVHGDTMPKGTFNSTGEVNLGVVQASDGGALLLFLVMVVCGGMYVVAGFRR